MSKREKARVHRVWTLLGPRWAWEHRCAWKGYALTNSYPLETWRQALNGACQHLGECWP